MIDSTIIRAHRCAAGATTEMQNQALGRSRDGFGTKIHLRCNAVGLPIGAVLSEGETHDVTAYPNLMQQRDSDPGAMLADKATTAMRSARTCAIAARRRKSRPSAIARYSTRSTSRFMHCGHGLSASLAISRSSGASLPVMTSSLSASWDCFVRPCS